MKNIAARLNKTQTQKRSLQITPKQPTMKMYETSTSCSSLMKKNDTEMLELFEIAKKSADVANAKGLLLAKEETSICVDTLSLLVSFPICSIVPETRRIIQRLEHLTKHKDRKICNSASALLHHWTQSIRDQQRRAARLNKTQTQKRSLQITPKHTPETGEFKNKKHPTMKMCETPKNCPSLRKKSDAEMLELFEIAKKSADVANVKGLLLAKEETSICVDTLCLLVSFPISSTAPETRRIMQRLEHLTKHKDRKICSSALALLHHWTQSIREQQCRDAHKTQG